MHMNVDAFVAYGSRGYVSTRDPVFANVVSNTALANLLSRNFERTDNMFVRFCLVGREEAHLSNAYKHAVWWSSKANKDRKVLDLVRDEYRLMATGGWKGDVFWFGAFVNVAFPTGFKIMHRRANVGSLFGRAEFVEVDPALKLKDIDFRSGDVFVIMMRHSLLSDEVYKRFGESNVCCPEPFDRVSAERLLLLDLDGPIKFFHAYERRGFMWPEDVRVSRTGWGYRSGQRLLTESKIWWEPEGMNGSTSFLSGGDPHADIDNSTRYVSMFIDAMDQPVRNPNA